MEKIKFVIQTLEDAGPDRKKPYVDGLDKEKVRKPVDVTVGILEDMTAAHKCGVSFLAEMDDGTFVEFLLTEPLTDSLFKVYELSKKKFAKLQVKRGFEPFTKKD